MSLYVAIDDFFRSYECDIPDDIKVIWYNHENDISKFTSVDALLVRSISTINSITLPISRSRLKFIGSFTSGIDHLDIPYLQNHRIHIAYAGGCNAQAVTEYIIMVLCLWESKHNTTIQKFKVGIMGYGHVGQSVHNILKKWGISCMLYDPPYAKTNINFHSCTLHELLSCDILTIHASLNKDGKYSSYKWLMEDKIRQSKWQLIINTSRGDVVDEKSTLRYLKYNSQIDYVSDVWSNEPFFNDDFMQQCWLATPHIAGYSTLSKHRAWCMIMNQLIEFFALKQRGIKPILDYDNCSDYIYINNDLDTLDKILHYIIRITEYHQMMVDMCGMKITEKGKKFRTCRPSLLRSELSQMAISSCMKKKYPILGMLGCHTL